MERFVFTERRHKTADNISVVIRSIWNEDCYIIFDMYFNILRTIKVACVYCVQHNYVCFIH